MNEHAKNQITTTCIIAVEHEGKTYIGGDSAGVRVNVLALRRREDSKVFRKGEILFGFSGSFRGGQILRYSFNPPKLTEGQDEYEYLCTTFINEVRNVLKTNGLTRVYNNHNEAADLNFLLGFRGKVYAVESDFQVGRILPGYDACGCGEEYAMGAIKALRDEAAVTDPVKLILAGLRTAGEFSAGVCPPYKIICSDGAEWIEDAQGLRQTIPHKEPAE